MMNNDAKIKGDKNLILQGIRDSSINVKGKTVQKKQSNVYAIIGIIVALITATVTIIIGWDNIIKFFQT